MSLRINPGSYISFFRVLASFIAIFTWGLLQAAGALESLENLSRILMAVGVVGIFDVLINDFLPDKFHWKLVLRHRHYLLAAMAFCYMAQLFVAFKYVKDTGLIYYYLLNAFALMAVAMVDATQRSRREKWSTACRN